MSKQITPRELAEIVSLLLTNPEATNGFDSADTHGQFMHDIGQVVADHCGGEINCVIAETDPESDVEFERGPSLSVYPNDSLPSMQNNVWSPYDADGWEGESVDGIDEGIPLSKDQVRVIRSKAQSSLHPPSETPTPTPGV